MALTAATRGKIWRYFWFSVGTICKRCSHFKKYHEILQADDGTKEKKKKNER